MNFITMGEAADELRPRISGGTCRFETAAARINQATRRIMNRPRKPIHIERVVRFFTRKDAIALPAEIGKILHYTIDRSPAPLFGRAYEFVSGGWGELDCGDGMASKFLVDLGAHWPTMFEIPSMEWDEDNRADEPLFTPQRLVAFSEAQADAGLEMRISGRGNMNHSLGAPDPGVVLPISRWKDGVEGSFELQPADNAVPLFSLSDPVRAVEGVVKPRTQGHVSLYTYDETTHQMYFLSKYHPNETAPRYRKYRITAPDFTDGVSVYALCEMAYVPLDHADDILIVQNMDALKMMVMALEFENEREFQAAKAYEADAYRLIEDQRSSERTHDYNLIQVSAAYGFGDVRAL
jgi:hypothetical protein